MKDQEEFRNEIRVELPSSTPINKEAEKFDPNIVAKQIKEEQLQEFAALVKGTPNQYLIAFKDEKVQELVSNILSASIFENERLNSDTFPIEIFSRYKADKSLQDKLEDWSKREEKNGAQVTDYLGIRIVPEAEHSIFFSEGDPILQELIDKREKVRRFLAKTYKRVAENPEMTFKKYCNSCKAILRKLQEIFPDLEDRYSFY